MSRLLPLLLLSLPILAILPVIPAQADEIHLKTGLRTSPRWHVVRKG